ncbi:MAG: hypothetical protein WAK82_14465 [Streptosporangiaceae bacterium]
MNPRDRLRPASRRWPDPAEALAQQVTERILDLVVRALDVNDLAARIDLNALAGRLDVDTIMKKIDLNALLDQVDLNALLNRIDVNAMLDRLDLRPILDRVDVNDLVRRIDMDALVQDTDLGAVMARSSGGLVSEGLDGLRSQAVGLDQFIDRWVRRLLRRKHPWPAAPSAMLAPRAAPVQAAIVPPQAAS